jgi:hypothetical protein
MGAKISLTARIQLECCFQYEVNTPAVQIEFGQSFRFENSQADRMPFDLHYLCYVESKKLAAAPAQVRFRCYATIHPFCTLCVLGKD